MPELVHAGGPTLTLALIGGLISGLAAYLSVRFLMRYFETKSLNPFAYYCLAAGTLSGAYFLARRAGLVP